MRVQSPKGTLNVKPQGSKSPVTRGETRRNHSDFKHSRIRGRFPHASPLAIACNRGSASLAIACNRGAGVYQTTGVPCELGHRHVLSTD